ncbi:MAG: DUF6514 family protein [Acetivibrionales bacterium]
MVSKFLHRRVEIECSESGYQVENIMELEYYLTESVTDSTGTDDIKKTYGVGIKKKQQGVLGESIYFYNVYPSKKKTMSLVELLAEQTVTPSTLAYIMDDLLGM